MIKRVICIVVFLIAALGLASVAIGQDSDDIRVAEPIGSVARVCNFNLRKVERSQTDVIACYFQTKSGLGHWIVASVETGNPDVSSTVVELQQLGVFVAAFVAIRNEAERTQRFTPSVTIIDIQ